MATFFSLSSSRGIRRVSIVALAALLLLPPLAGGQGRPQFRTRVDVVQFQVRVSDAAGNFVPGLVASDFQLRVDGDARSITTVYEVSVLEETGTATAAADLPPAAWRQWILFFDAAFNTPRGVVAAQEAARDFVENQAQPRDLIGVSTFSTVTGARMVVPLTRDRAQVLEAIGGLGLNSATRNVDRAGFLAQTMAEALDVTEDPGGAAVTEAIEEAIRQVATLEFDQYSSVVAQYTQQIGTIGDMLRTIRGRKHVMYFSQGFDDAVLTGQSLDELSATTDAIQQNAGLAIAQSSGGERFGSAEVRSELDDTLKSLRSADAVIHVVDPSGLGGGRDQTGLRSMGSSQGDFNARGSTRSALTSMADSTGGEMYWDTNDLAGALTEIEEANRSYYVVAFARDSGDEEILELDVEVSTAGAVVDAPEEIAAPIDYAEMNDIEKQIQIAEFVTKGIEESDLIFDVATGGFYGDGELGRLPVVIEVPWTQMEELADSGGDEKVELEIYSYALDESDRMVDLGFGEVSLNMGAMRNSQSAGLPFRYYDLLWARPGQRRVRVILRDKELGRISSFTSAPVTVSSQASGEVSIAGPMVIDWDHQGLIMKGFDADKPPAHKADGPVAFPFMVGVNEITPAATAAGSAGSEHYAYFVAHNLGRGPDGPQAMVALALQSPAGEPIPLGPEAQAMVARFYDEATDGTQMVVKATLPPGLPPGYYGLVIILSDQVKGVNLTASVPLWVQ